MISGLDRQADNMHRAGQAAEVSAPVTDVALWLVRPEERAAWLKAVQSLGLAGEELASGRFRYVHQLWQEFFAARGIRGKFDDLPPGLSPPPLVPIAEVLRGLAVQDPLPGPGVSPWEEAIKIAVQLSPTPAKWIASLMSINLPLAGRAALAVCMRLPGELLADLRRRLVARSRDPAFDLRFRIEAAEALGPLGDPRYREGRGTSNTPYLLPDDNHWVNIEGGEYTLGSHDGDPNEKPVIKVQLEPFYIAWAPVTNAEFACFVEAGGYEDERWWIGESSSLWWRGEWSDIEMMQQWRIELTALREDFDDAVARYYPHVTPSFIESHLREHAAWTKTEAEERLELRFAPQRHRIPGEWHNPRFNQPSQPVVGVSLFEALAYCRWISIQCGRTVRLPVEAEWEAAARGVAADTWPWGNQYPDSSQINADPAHLRRSSPVGVFPNGDATRSSRIADMSGNVWEWTASKYADQHHRSFASTTVDDGMGPRATRGGSWYNRSDLCRASCRRKYLPGNRGYYLGFRVVRYPSQRR